MGWGDVGGVWWGGGGWCWPGGLGREQGRVDRPGAVEDPEGEGGRWAWGGAPGDTVALVRRPGALSGHTPCVAARRVLGRARPWRGASREDGGRPEQSGPCPGSGSAARERLWVLLACSTGPGVPEAPGLAGASLRGRPWPLSLSQCPRPGHTCPRARRPSQRPRLGALALLAPRSGPGWAGLAGSRHAQWADSRAGWLKGRWAVSWPCGVGWAQG